MEETANNVERVRFNLSQNSKGLVSFDITSEFSTVEKAKEELDKGIKAIREVIKNNNLVEVGNSQEK